MRHRQMQQRQISKQFHQTIIDSMSPFDWGCWKDEGEEFHIFRLVHERPPLATHLKLRQKAIRRQVRNFGGVRVNYEIGSQIRRRRRVVYTTSTTTTTTL